MKKNPLGRKESGTMPSKKKTTKSSGGTNISSLDAKRYKPLNALNQNPGFGKGVK